MRVPAFKVTVYEYERGWGNRVAWVEYFPGTEQGETESAEAVTRFNDKNTPAFVPGTRVVQVPDSYFKAMEPELVMVDESKLEE